MDSRDDREGEALPVLPPIRSEDILRGGREAIIIHPSGRYRLRETSNGKLILTK